MSSNAIGNAEIFSLSPTLSFVEETKHRARAKYIPQANGGLKLSSVEMFDVPMFRESGWEDFDCGKPKNKIIDDAWYFQKEAIKRGLCEKTVELTPELKQKEQYFNHMRAIRRAKNGLTDSLMCNTDLNAFVTLTVSTNAAHDRCDWNESYKLLRVWLSNNVQRHGLKYIVAPERHKDGAIHYHMICNGEALKIIRAVSAKTGRNLTRKGKPLYNVKNWKHGFSTMQYIGKSSTEHEFVAKYVQKYITKDSELIGGRYFLKSQNLVKPVYLYGETAEEFFSSETPKFQKSVQVYDDLHYYKYSFI